VRLVSCFGRPQSAATSELRRVEAALARTLAPHCTALGLAEITASSTTTSTSSPLPFAALGGTLDAVLEAALQRIAGGQSAHQTFLWLESMLIRLIRVQRHLGNIQVQLPFSRFTLGLPLPFLF
jgi:hypothetical protein